MRLIQFNSGLRVVLKDVQPQQQQQQQTDPTPRYYLATPTHHSSNSSLATTSSSIKSTGSIGTNQEYYIHRQYYPTSNTTIYQQCHRVKTPPVLNTTGSSTIIVEVGKRPMFNKQMKNNTYSSSSIVGRCRWMCHIYLNDRHV